MGWFARLRWTDSHLWLIYARGCTWGVPDPDFPDDTIPAHRTLVLDMIADIGTNRFKYIYDFGDHWSHTVRIVKPMPAVPHLAYPLLIDAVGRCPLEDSGGPPGYMEMLEALRDPTHPRHAEVTEWPGRDFDPSDANRVQLEQDVATLARSMSPRRPTSAKPKQPQKRRKPSNNDLF